MNDTPPPDAKAARLAAALRANLRRRKAAPTAFTTALSPPQTEAGQADNSDARPESPQKA
jgi:hypothetical protein